jgi:hypothetical protein
VIPGATEFGYDPKPRVRLVSPGTTETENAHQSSRISDWTLSIDELVALCPNLEHVSLVVSWFGDDLRCGECSVRPKVEAAGRAVKGTSWSVAGISRASAEVVSSHEGGPAYGGTPSDAAVLAAIADLKARGLQVTLYPMLLMDIAADNGMGQPPYPWRGRISCTPAPGTVGTPDGTATAAAQVAAFVGSSTSWGYRRFVRHHAALAAEAGADALIIGSEMRGLTSVRGAGGSFPFVSALTDLAAEAEALAPGVKLTYAADWSEYGGYSPDDAPGDRLYPLDALWASSAIAAVGIDNYMPVADWRDGEDHPDAATWDGPHQLDYLGANVAGGEGFDWFYASDADRLAGERTPITDGAYGEPWVWRFKDIAGWWGNAHHPRIGGVRQAAATAWVPQSKPIWFTELGCAAVDKGANQPNVFADPKSAEGGKPWFSSGAPDALMQRQVLRAHLKHWGSDANPVSEAYGAPMVDVARVSLWTWDARPYPAFPALTDTWSDAVNHATGHWLTGRLGGLASDELIAAVAADFGIEVAAADAALPFAHGLAVEAVGSARDALAPLLGATGLGVRDGVAGLEFAAATARGAVAIAADDLVATDAALRSRRRPDPSEAVGRLALGYVDRLNDYLSSSVTAMRPEGGAVAGDNSPLVLDGAGARAAAEHQLIAASARRDTLDLTLPPSLAALDVGDVIDVAGEADGPFEIAEIRDGLARKISARALPPAIRAVVLGDGPKRATVAAVPGAVPLVVLAHLPPDPTTPGQSRLVAAAWASPWPGSVDLQLASTGARLARLSKAATLGELATPLTPGPIHRWDHGSLTIQLYGGHIASIDESAALAGGNRVAVETDAGQWEVLGFAGAELVAPGTYRLSGLLRGLAGSDVAMGASSVGNRVVLLDDRVSVLPVETGWLGDTLGLRVFAGRSDAEGSAVDVPLGLAPVLPLPPVHLRARRSSGGDVALSSVRRSRADSGTWSAADVPLEVSPEAYRVTIFDGTAPVRQIEVAAPAATYTAAEQTADFGTLPGAFDFTVAQLSPVFGPGAAGEGRFDA